MPLVPVGDFRRVYGTVTTAGGVTAAIAAVTIPEGKCSYISAYVVAKNTGANEGYAYTLVGAYRRAAGVVTAVTGGPLSGVTMEDDGTANTALVIVGTTVEIRGTSPAAKTLAWVTLAEVLDQP